MSIYQNLSIVIPSIGRPGLQDCIQSIRRVSPDIEIVLVTSLKIYQDTINDDECVFIKEPSNYTSIAQVFNAGFCVATRDWIMWLNDDMELFALPDIELDCNVMYALGIITSQARRYPEYFVKRHIVDYPDVSLMSRQLGDRLGWWATDYRFYFADVDLACKAWLYADGVKTLKGSLVYHSLSEDNTRKKNQPFYTDDHRVFYSYWESKRAKLEQAMMECNKGNLQ